MPSLRHSAPDESQERPHQTPLCHSDSLLVVFFMVGIRMRGENETLKSNIARLEKSVEYYEATLFQLLLDPNPHYK